MHEQLMDETHEALARVEALHHKGTMDFLSPECSAEQCDHDDGCPDVPRDVCVACWRNAEEISPYFAEENCPEWVLWPCSTIGALRVGTGAAAPPRPRLNEHTSGSGEAGGDDE